MHDTIQSGKSELTEMTVGRFSEKPKADYGAFREKLGVPAD